MVQQAQETGNRGPIRIKFDTSQIMTDPYACHEAGDRIQTGLSPHSQAGNYGDLPECTSDGDDPCIYVCKDYDVITPALFNVTQSILDSMSKIFSSLILVDQAPVLQLSQYAYDAFGGQCSYGVNIPKTAVSPGIPDTDLIVYVTIRPPTSNNIIAYAMACNYDVIDASGVYGRPLAANINFNPYYYRNFVGTNRDEFTYNQYIRVGIHEMIHALGFSSTFYDSFVKPDGEYYSAARTVKRSGTTPDGKTYSYSKAVIDSPNVVSFVKDHYACGTASYAELEDAGGSGTAGSHWETRTAGEEIMVGFASPVAPITNLTLSLLKDTGWYDINYDRAEPLIWGKGLGCDFLDNCYEYTWNFQGYFCKKTGALCSSPTNYLSKIRIHLHSIQSSIQSSPLILKGNQISSKIQYVQSINQSIKVMRTINIYLSSIKFSRICDMRCTGTRMGKGLCVIEDYSSSLPRPYQHFKDDAQGGINEAADYCPFYQVSKSLPLTQWCGDTSQLSNLDSSVGEIFGESSRCFEYRADAKSNQTDMACWPMQCAGTKVQIQVAGTWVTCEKDGQVLSVNNIYVVCPEGFPECGGSANYIDIDNNNSSATIYSDITRFLKLLFIDDESAIIINYINIDTVDNIVQRQSFLKFQNIKSDINDGLFNGKESSVYTPLPSYKCQHERLVDKWKNHYSTDGLTHYDDHLHHQHRQQKQQSLMKMVSQQSMDSTSSHTIRILFNTTYLENDPYSCSYVGQKVMVGDSSTPTGKVVTNACTDDGASNECIYTCQQQDILNVDLRSLINQYIIPTIKSSLENYINIPEYQSPDVLKLSTICATLTKGQCIYGVQIPHNYLTPGIANYDMVIWVTARPASSKETIAYALPCNQNIYTNGRYGRPLAGSINFNPLFFTPFIKSSNKFTFNEYIRVGIHEMTHALGFTSTLYNSYLDSHGNFYDASTVITKKGVTPSGNSYSYQKYAIDSPNVVNFIKQHYQCDSIRYAELEDSGAAGTAGSHWEKRTAGEEYMIGYVSPIAPITNLTLALLQDTGWYHINTTGAETLVWGRNLGCSWLIDQCSAQTWNYQGYFCEQSGAVGCSPTRVGKGMCGKTAFTQSLPAQYQHFATSNVGGVDEVADYCPYYQVFSNQKQTYYCGDTSNSGDSSVGEQFGTESRCFEFAKGSAVGQACWQHRCVDTHVEINIKGTWVACSSNSTTVTANGVTVICPVGGFAECNGVPIQVLVQDSSSAISSRVQRNHLIALSMVMLLVKFFI
ncbi:hypothetical protein PPL_05594 [Heterostelium album PN500]|uniref:Cell surface protease n=1 Tax=Heterostelium pallidum (strain ATCC 26659 / Pp 5 / PN500) TaxID=670386 RepID=D3BAL6_HETP5|nr:hypothetical protein PPL_05594 [Heterostelium album PN500]EFA81603.1 hypothetical protein PPL_05594 [Heterostelium album PN500]|eukprot:XP_020433720.1 hypothetical protein PPL_05594 [Heterostelium album PN500]